MQRPEHRLPLAARPMAGFSVWGLQSWCRKETTELTDFDDIF
jgi:hypothetical protein